MDDYAYINARVKAMQGRLFTRARYESLLAQNTMTGLLEALRESPYARALEWAIQIPTQGFSLNEIARIDEWAFIQRINYSIIPRNYSRREQHAVELENECGLSFGQAGGQTVRETLATGFEFQPQQEIIAVLLIKEDTLLFQKVLQVDSFAAVNHYLEGFRSRRGQEFIEQRPQDFGPRSSSEGERLLGCPLPDSFQHLVLRL